EIADRSDSGQEEVAAAADGDESGKSVIASPHWIGRNRERVESRAVRSNQRIAFVVHAGEGWIVQPGRLPEIELTRDIGGHANEVQSAVWIVRRRVGPHILHWWSVLPSASQQAMAFVQRHRSCRARVGVQRVARMTATNVRSNRTPQAGRVSVV